MDEKIPLADTTAKQNNSMSSKFFNVITPFAFASWLW